MSRVIPDSTLIKAIEGQDISYEESSKIYADQKDIPKNVEKILIK